MHETTQPLFDDAPLKASSMQYVIATTTWCAHPSRPDAKVITF
jgi:hypothetical protein